MNRKIKYLRFVFALIVIVGFAHIGKSNPLFISPSTGNIDFLLRNELLTVDSLSGTLYAWYRDRTFILLKTKPIKIKFEKVIENGYS